jgi:hypothetical protein
MFNLAIDSKPRGCDVVALKVEDVWTAPCWQGLSSRLQLGRCGHVFGLLMRFT